MSSGKRKRDEYPGQLPSGSFVPQQDGSADQIVEFVVSKVTISVIYSIHCLALLFLDTLLQICFCFLELFSAMLALLGLVAQFEDLFLIPQFTMKRVFGSQPCPI